MRQSNLLLHFLSMVKYVVRSFYKFYHTQKMAMYKRSRGVEPGTTWNKSR